MALPTASDVHYNQTLTNFGVGYAPEVKPIADMMFPPLNVVKQSDRYLIYSIADWNRSQMEMRAPGTETAGGGWRLSDDTYYADVFGLHKDIDDQTRSNEDEPLNLEQDAVRWLMKQAALKREYAWATEHFTTGLWTGSTTGSDITPSTLWDASGSTPVKDVRAQARSMKLKTGYKPNTFLIGGEAWDALCDNSDIIDRIKYTQRGMVTEDIVAALFDVEKVIVGDTMHVTSKEGAASTVTAAMYGKHALLAYVPKTLTKSTPAAGVTFRWNGLRGMVGGDRIKNFRMEALSSDRIEIESAFDQKQTGPQLGVFFASVRS